MKLSRRSFLGSLAAAGAVIAGSPAAAFVQQDAGRLILEGKKLVLNRTLNLTNLTGFRVANCEFHAGPDFAPDDPLVRMAACFDGFLSECSFFLPNGGLGPALFFEDINEIYIDELWVSE